MLTRRVTLNVVVCVKFGYESVAEYQSIVDGYAVAHKRLPSKPKKSLTLKPKPCVKVWL